MSTATPQRGTLVRAAVVAVVVAAAGCAGGAPDVPAGPDGEPDPVLVAGRDVWTDRCANCHGGDGGGGRGPKLNNGAVVDAYPDAADEAIVIAQGKGQMPSFSGRLTAAEIDAVVRYTREVLG